MVTLFLVRHGEAENNVQSIADSIESGKEYHLTEKGRGQVEKTAKYLAKKGVGAILSSPITRAKETAAIISQHTGVAVQFDDRLRETGLGIYSGQSIQKFFAAYPDPRDRIDGDRGDGVENFRDMRSRMQEFLSDVAVRFDGKKVVVVSHGDPLEQLHGLILGESVEKTATGWYPVKGASTELTWVAR